MTHETNFMETKRARIFGDVNINIDSLRQAFIKSEARRKIMANLLIKMENSSWEKRVRKAIAERLKTIPLGDPNTIPILKDSLRLEFADFPKDISGGVFADVKEFLSIEKDNHKRKSDEDHY